MTLRTNPPPIRIPPSLSKDPETNAFFQRLLRDIYLIWAKTGGGSVVQIEEGGTGANTAAGARSNLDVYSIGEVDTELLNYLLLAGRSGGQIATGGTGSGDDLTLRSTSHATKGNVFFGTSLATNYDEINDLINLQALILDTSATQTVSEGMIRWNDDDKTAILGMPGGSLHYHLGQEVFLPGRAKNETGATLNRGTVVYVNGASGAKPTIAKADASTEALSSKTIGIVSESIDDNDLGYVSTFGRITGTASEPINTSAYSEGDTLWLSETAGEFTGTKPTSPAHAVVVGYVLSSHATTGTIYVHVTNGNEYYELHDVDDTLNAPSAGAMTAWNNGNTLWEEATDLTYDFGSDRLGIGSSSPQEKLSVSGNLLLPKTSGNGIKVDLTTPTFGWRDLLGEIRVRGVGATDPSDATYRGGIKAFQFAVNDEAWVNFHIPHDYVAGSDIHLHFHWSHISTLVTGGSVTWGYEITYAKGHNQAAFIAPVSGTFAGNASTTQYQHIITETQISAASPSGSQIDSDNLEPDGVLVVRVYLSANNITSSGAVPDPFLHFSDVHYQSTNIATKDKVPDFYT